MIIKMLLSLFVVSVGGFIIREVFIALKRKLRKGELRYEIGQIVHQIGCGNAIERFEKCKHISEHYLITFSEAGFKGDLAELRREAEASARVFKPTV